MKNMKNENAVSPVIGVILMVVITVIIAAILAVFAFGIGGPAKAPEAQLRYQAVNNGSLVLTVSNSGGDSLILANQNFSIYNAATGAIILGQNMDQMFRGTYLAPGISLVNTSNTVVIPATILPARGDIIQIKVLDIPTGQMVSDAKVTVQ
jgi:flagellin-like protein